jgi:hypothetical protein
MSNLSVDVKSIVDKAKAEGHAVFALNISGTKYYYRSINRAEFKELQELLTTEAEKAKAEALKKNLDDNDPKIEEINIKLEKDAAAIRDKGEDRLVAKGLLYPSISQNTPAGVIANLADRIMQASGYGSEEEPEIL